MCTSILEFSFQETQLLVVFFCIVILGLLYEISRKLVQMFDYDRESN